MRYLSIVFLILLSSVLGACATAKPAPDAFGNAERAIEAAVRAGAEEHSPVEMEPSIADGLADWGAPSHPLLGD